MCLSIQSQMRLQHLTVPLPSCAAVQTENLKAVGYSAFVGGMLFWIGAYLAVLQAMNTERFIRPHAGYEAADTDATTTASATGSTTAGTSANSGVVHIKPHTPRHTVLKRLASTKSSSSNSRVSDDRSQQQQQQLQQQQQQGDIEAQQQKHNGHSTAAPSSSTTATTTTAVTDRNGTDSANGYSSGSYTTDGYSGQPPVEAWTWRLLPHKGSVRWREAGYIASIVQFVGATAFSFSVIAGFPGVIAGEYDAKYKVRSCQLLHQQLHLKILRT
jgi:hypothetical protein